MRVAQRLSVNVLTAEEPTDWGGGSGLYDAFVEVSNVKLYEEPTPSVGAIAAPTNQRCSTAEADARRANQRLRNRIQCLQSQASARARRNALSRALRVSVAAAVNSERASASRPARNRKSPLAAGNGA